MLIQFEWQSLLFAFIKMILALFCGGVLGIERGRKKRPAGMRTYMLVCLGATLVMMTNEYICLIYGTGDVARMGAQVVNGIGFLGAGTIITTGHNRVKGLTTAAGLWVAGCIGLAIGSGYYVAALIGTFMIFVIMVLLHNFDQHMLTTAKVIILYVELESISVVQNFNRFMKENEIAVDDIEIENGQSLRYANVAAVMTLRLPARTVHAELIKRIENIEGILHVEEV